TTVALFMMHGNIYLILKTEGELQVKLRRWVKITIPIFMILFLIVGIITPFVCPHIETAFEKRPITLLLLFTLALLLAFNIPREIHKGREFLAFLSSCGTMLALMTLFGASVYPTMVFSTPNLANSLTIYNGSSTDKTLQFMAIVALIGVPIVLTYTASVYYIFRGKVEITDESY
ncbi:MAG: cytochrome d ubiquinol oxidase subunit II, partial [Puniceicoccales bacterium]